VFDDVFDDGLDGAGAAAGAVAPDDAAAAADEEAVVALEFAADGGFVCACSLTTVSSITSPVIGRG
jgi:hypothetical protein